MNLAYGAWDTPGEDSEPRSGVRVGDRVLDLSELMPELFAGGNLDVLLAAGPEVWASTHERVADLLSGDPGVIEPHLLALDDVEMRLPFTVADYVDFYASEHHATNVGRLFRPDQPLTPNWKHQPLGYHGRAGTVVVSGTPIKRPSGNRRVGEEIVHGPSLRLDFEAELGFVVGAPAEDPVAADDFAQHVFGVCVVNDWSARDLQAFEYVPLGPFLGKSFATSISPWVTPLSALSGVRVPVPERDVPVSDYLLGGSDWGLDLTFEVAVNGTVISRPPYASMYWSGPQMLAHLTSNGASLRTGDLFASGTISGPDPDQWGSLLELTRGEGPFLADGDEVTITAYAAGLALGAVTGRVAPR